MRMLIWMVVALIWCGILGLLSVVCPLNFFNCARLNWCNEWWWNTLVFGPHWAVKREPKNSVGLTFIRIGLLRLTIAILGRQWESHHSSSFPYTAYSCERLGNTIASGRIKHARLHIHRLDRGHCIALHSRRWSIALGKLHSVDVHP